MCSKQARTGLGVAAVVAGSGMIAGSMGGCVRTIAPTAELTPAPLVRHDAAVPASLVSERKPQPPTAFVAEVVSPDDVITWTKGGRPRGEIVEKIETSGRPVKVFAADENRLRDAGVSEDVIEAMKATARR